MTPEEAGSFHEDDEDPGKIFAAFDGAGRGVTAAPDAAAQIRWGIDYIRDHYSSPPRED